MPRLPRRQHGRYLSVACLALSTIACGGGKGSSTTPTSPTPSPVQTATLNVKTRESAPTQSTNIVGATVRVTSGAKAGTSGVTDGAGNVVILDVPVGAVSVEASAPGYETASASVTLPSDQVAIDLRPTFRTLSGQVVANLSGGDAVCPLTTTPCARYRVPLHHDGTIDATLTWTDSDTWLWLELWDSTRLLAQSTNFRANGLLQSVTANAKGGADYELRVRYVSGARVTAFTLKATSPN